MSYPNGFENMTKERSIEIMTMHGDWRTISYSISLSSGAHALHETFLKKLMLTILLYIDNSFKRLINPTVLGRL